MKRGLWYCNVYFQLSDDVIHWNHSFPVSLVLHGNYSIKMAPERFSYPNVRRDESAITDYHGTKISDPYIWLEDPDSKETEAFVEQQNAITMPYLADCEIREHFKTRWDKLIFTGQQAARRRFMPSWTHFDPASNMALVLTDVALVWSNFTNVRNLTRQSSPRGLHCIIVSESPFLSLSWLLV